MTTLYHKKGIPDDLLTSNKEGGREIKVALTKNNQVSTELLKSLYLMRESNKLILNQLELLNARFEEAFQTKINKGDL